MRILMCLEGDFPPDIRVEREAKALTAAGHNVYVLSLDAPGKPIEENIGYATVLRRIPLRPFRYRAWTYANIALRGVSPLWSRPITDAIIKYNIDAVHVHDLPLVKTGLKAAKKKGIPLVADLHENYPEVVRNYNLTWKGKAKRMLIGEQRWRGFERSWLKQSDRVITVVEEIKQHYVRDYGIPDSKITVVMNAEDLDSFLSLPIHEDIVKKYQSYFTIMYVGGFGIHRGLQTTISAMPKILTEIPEARLVLVGTLGNDVYLRDLAREKGVENAVEFVDWQPFELVPSYMVAGRVCLMPYSGHAQTNLAPNKLFQYMALGKPVVAAAVGSQIRLMEDTGGGLLYPPEDADALAEAVIKIYRDKNLAEKFSRAGLNAVKTKYNWKMEGKKLTDLYQNLFDTGTGSH